MKVKKLENFHNISGLKGCKWVRLNSPGTETPHLIMWHEIFSRTGYDDDAESSENLNSESSDSSEKKVLHSAH